jgi:hypothetical protein
MLGVTQFVVREAAVVRTPYQIHASFQRFEAMGSMTTCARQHCQALAQGAIEPLNKGRIPDRSALRLVQQLVRLLFFSQG